MGRLHESGMSAEVIKQLWLLCIHSKERRVSLFDDLRIASLLFTSDVVLLSSFTVCKQEKSSAPSNGSVDFPLMPGSELLVLVRSFKYLRALSMSESKKFDLLFASHSPILTIRINWGSLCCSRAPRLQIESPILWLVEIHTTSAAIQDGKWNQEVNWCCCLFMHDLYQIVV